MSEQPRRRGRKKGEGMKPPGEKFVGFLFRMPPALKGRFQQFVPAGQRSAFLQGLLEKALDEEAARLGLTGKEE